MSFTNINVAFFAIIFSDVELITAQDPAGVKALLEQLRSSQAWSESLASPVPVPAPAPAPIPTHTRAPVIPEDAGVVPLNYSSGATVLASQPSVQSSLPPISGPSSSSVSVSDLLSQLSATGYGHTSPSIPPQHEIQNHTPKPAPIRSARPKQDVRSLTFQQALPHLASLSDDADFVAAIKKVSESQYWLT